MAFIGLERFCGGSFKNKKKPHTFRMEVFIQNMIKSKCTVYFKMASTK